MSDNKLSKAEASSVLRKKGKYFFELDVDEDNAKNPVQSVQALTDRCILVKYKANGLLKLFYVAVKELSDFDEVEIPPLEKGSLAFVTTFDKYIVSVFTGDRSDYLRVTDFVNKVSFKKHVAVGSECVLVGDEGAFVVGSTTISWLPQLDKSEATSITQIPFPARAQHSLLNLSRLSCCLGTTGLLVGGTKMIAVDLSTGQPLTNLVQLENPVNKVVLGTTHAAAICLDLVATVNLKTSEVRKHRIPSPTCLSLGSSGLTVLVGTALGFINEYDLENCSLVRRYGEFSNFSKKSDVRIDPKLMIGKLQIIDEFLFAWTGNGTMHIYALIHQDPEAIHSHSFGKKIDSICYVNDRICVLAGSRYHVIEVDLERLKKIVEQQSARQMSTLWDLNTRLLGSKGLKLHSLEVKGVKVNDVFEGKQLMDWLLSNKEVKNKEDAVILAGRLLIRGFFTPVSDNDRYEDKHTPNSLRVFSPEHHYQLLGHRVRT